jgi:hypothetical protein
MKTFKKWIIPLALVSATWTSYAQDDTSLLGVLETEDKEAIEALVLYPEETREAILEATLHPELLIRIKGIQTETQTKFDALLAPYTQETQATLWDVTRYPGLVDRLASIDRYHLRELDQILEDYPEVIHKRARTAFDRYYDELRQINAIAETSDAAFEALLSAYDVTTQQAYRKLLELPEVLSIMSENIDLVVLTGDLYQRDPELIRGKADSLHLVLARQQAQELADWQEELENNEAIRDDLMATAEEFAEAHEYEYDDLYYDYEGDDLYYNADEEVEMEVRAYHYYHYPYWFGYPRWYVYPRWRPYPYWWEWGFYIGPRRQIVIIDLPSYYFVNWYFYYPHHHYYYPRVTDQFIRHYRYHPRSNSSITIGVNNWRNNNREVITKSWIAKEQNRVERIRDYGKFEWERRRYNEDRPAEAKVSQSEFFEKYARRYPSIDAEPRTKGTPPRQRQELEIPRKPDTAPSRTKRRQPEMSKPTPPKTETKRFEDLQKAKEMHRRKWEPKVKISPRTRKTVPEKLKKTPPKKRTSTRKSKKSGNNN